MFGGIFLYERYELLKNELGLTDYRVSAETKISTATLTSWKNGAYIPKTDKLIILANYFNVSLDYLVGRSDERK